MDIESNQDNSNVIFITAKQDFSYKFYIVTLSERRVSLPAV